MKQKEKFVAWTKKALHLGQKIYCVFRTIFRACITVATVILIIYTLRRFNWQKIEELHFSFPIALISFVLFFFAICLKSQVYYRAAAPEFGLLGSIRILFVSHLGNMIFSISMGDRMKKRFFPDEIGFERSFFLAWLPKILDMIVLFTMTLITISIYDVAGRLVGVNMFHIWLVVMSLMMIAILIAGSLERYRAFVWRFVKRQLPSALFWDAAYWGLVYLSIFFGLRAAGMSLKVCILGGLGVFLVTNVLMLIPLTPGGLGLFELAAAAGLGFFSFDKEANLRAALILHMIQYAAVLPFGLFLYFYRKDKTWKFLKKFEKK